MTKIYIARAASAFEDAYKAFATNEEAIRQANMFLAHLTDSEKKTNTVSVESYTIEGYDGTPEEIFRDALIDDEVGDPDTYEVIA